MGICCDASRLIQVPYRNLALGVEADELVRTELQVSDRDRTGRFEELLYTALTIYVDPATSILGFVRTDGEEGLDGVIGDAAVDDVAG